MRAVSISAFAALLAGILAWLATASAQNEPRQDRNAQTVNIVLHSAQVNANRPDGKPWRSGDRKPDIVVKIKNLTQPTLREFRSQELHNVLAGAWTNAPAFTANVGDELQIDVVDHGTVKDAVIGDTKVKVTDDMLRKGKVTLRFGQVESLVLEFRK